MAEGGSSQCGWEDRQALMDGSGLGRRPCNYGAWDIDQGDRSKGGRLVFVS